MRSLTLISVPDVCFRIDELVLSGLLWTVAMPGSLGTTEQLRKLGSESSSISLEELEEESQSGTIYSRRRYKIGWEEKDKLWLPAQQ